MPNEDKQLPDVGQVLAKLLQRLPPTQQPLIIAYAERLAAVRYRDWGEQVGDANQRAGLRVCAEREEDIARRVEGLYENARALQAQILASTPEIEEINRTLFAGRTLQTQFTIQARGERLGAMTWRAFAQLADNEEARQVFLQCAPLEEESAEYLESLIA